MTKSIVQSYFGNIFVAITWCCIELSVAGVVHLTFRQVWEAGSLAPRLSPYHTAGSRKLGRAKGWEAGVQSEFVGPITEPFKNFHIG